ncbi:MAG: alpha/beta fold hydrolase [Planctomycetes bacterium]|nr:alpha/beta fold hydrolase [Planctomycetota bacterium]
MPHHRFWQSTLLGLAITATVSAQGPVSIGTRYVEWRNSTGAGATQLSSWIHYPAAVAGVDAPILPRTGGWPVIVFLHGYGAGAVLYSQLADAWVQRGFVVVLSDTSLFDWSQQPLDGIALHSAVLAANNDAFGPFANAFAPDRIAIAGHSMGGGNTATVLAQNPGYQCGFALAPALPNDGSPDMVEVPLGVLAGQGDWITPPALHAEPYYDAIGTAAPLKAYHLLDTTADHANIVSMFGGPACPAFAHAVEVSTSFFNHCLGLDAFALEQVCGDSVATKPIVVSHEFVATKPQMWLDENPTLGATATLSIAAQPGLAAIAAASSLGPAVPTEWGALLLDPVTSFVAFVGPVGANSRLDVGISIPDDPAFLNMPLALQGLGPALAFDYQVSNAAFVHVTD